MNLCQNLFLFYVPICLLRRIIILRATYIIKCEGLWTLVELQSKLEPGALPQMVRRGLYKSFVLAGAAIEEENSRSEYWKRILTPVQIRFKAILCQENFNRIYQDENVKSELVDIFESFIGITSGAHISTVQNIFEFMSSILSELPVLLNLYHNYQVVVQLILELFCECAKRMLCYLTQSESKKMYEYCLATVQTYARCNANRLTLEIIAEENSYQDLLLVMELLTNLLAKDCVDLSPFEPSTEENNITAADVCLYGLNFIMPLMTLDLLKYPVLCTQYYKMITFVNEIYPQKVTQLPEDLFRKLIAYVELGLTHFGSEILMSCLDFIQVLATHIQLNELHNSTVYQIVMPLLKILLDLLLSHQINSDMYNTASTSLFALICCYKEQYQSYVQNLIQSQSDPLNAERLASAFTELTSNIELKPERLCKLKFREKFDNFIVNVQGFLLVK